MSTIEEQLDAIQKYTANAIASCLLGELEAAQPKLDARDKCRAAITEPWNAALEAMQAVVKRNVREYSNCKWFCHYCKGSDVCEPERHVKGACYVAECQAALAAMEADLHETENVVE